ncbi:MAG: diguanylate cyclase [Rubrivivax sp.]|nr:diguanylate cyclase [Rubrivivax sp.]
MTPALDLQACLADGWQSTPDMPWRGVIVAALMMVGAWAATRRSFPGQHAFVALALAMLGWISFSALEQAATTAPCKATLALLAWPAILAVPPLWALFLHQYLQGERRVAALAPRVLLALPSLLLIAAALSNGQHGLLYGPDTVLGPPRAGLPRMVWDYGPLFYLAVAVNYAFVMLALALSLRGWRDAGADRRAPWPAFVAMMLVPLAANIAYLGFDLRAWGSDPTSLGFAAAALGFALLIRAERLFDVVPLACTILFNELPDPVLVLDDERRVIDANRAAVQLAGGQVTLGRPLAQWPGGGAALAALLDGAGGERPGELALGGRHWALRLREVGASPRRVGVLLQLQDVTPLRQAHAQVVQRLAARDAELGEAALRQARLREQALSDPLTGLGNRRALQERFAEEAAHAAANGQPLTLVLADLDHFKRINDTHGHAAGDAVLRDVGRLLRQGLRASDAVFRLGGEEFALLLPGADAGQAARRVQAVREALAGAAPARLAHAVTFSAGIAQLTAGGTLEPLMARADRALYEAKAGGRDRSVVAGPDGSDGFGGVSGHGAVD